MTFEHRHENKSCSACRDRLNERLEVVKVVKVAKIVKVKVFQFFQVFQNIPGSQLLSDVQTFFLTTLYFRAFDAQKTIMNNFVFFNVCCPVDSGYSKVAQTTSQWQLWL